MARAAESGQDAAASDADTGAADHQTAEIVGASDPDASMRETQVESVESTGISTPSYKENDDIAVRETRAAEEISVDSRIARSERADVEGKAKTVMDRESGPISLVKSTPLRPPGPVSLQSGRKAARQPQSDRRREGFVYQPLLVRSRLAGPLPPAHAGETAEETNRTDREPTLAGSDNPANA
jgi:hypothetical protein